MKPFYSSFQFNYFLLKQFIAEAKWYNPRWLWVLLSAKSFCYGSQKLRTLHKKDTAPIRAKLPASLRRKNFPQRLFFNLEMCCCIAVFLITSFQIHAQCHIDDFNALKAFHESTNGYEWNNRSFWDMVSEQDEPLADCDLSFLLGVSLNESGRVQSLAIFNNNLTGTLPETIELLAELTSLSLNDNQLSGELPQTLGNLNQLTNISLSNNSFSGALPDSFEMLTQLTTVFLDNNQFSGPLPDLTQFINIELFFIERNSFSGSLPQSLSQLSNLQYFVAYDNQLEGMLPDDIENLSNLQWLLLHQNQLSGCFPQSLCNLNVDSLNLTENPGLPNAGDTLTFTNFCLDATTQFNLPCNDNNDETIDDKIQPDCTCTGELMINVNELDFNAPISVYPNPVSSFIQINGVFNLVFHQFILFNQQGRVVIAGPLNNSSVISIEHLETGIYFLRLFQKDKQLIFRVVKS